MYLLIVNRQNRQKWDDSLDDHASALWEMRDGSFLVFSPLFSGDDEPDSSRVLLMENANFNLPPSLLCLPSASSVSPPLFLGPLEIVSEKAKAMKGDRTDRHLE